MEIAKFIILLDAQYVLELANVDPEAQNLNCPFSHARAQASFPCLALQSRLLATSLSSWVSEIAADVLLLPLQMSNYRDSYSLLWS